MNYAKHMATSSNVTDKKILNLYKIRKAHEYNIHPSFKNLNAATSKEEIAKGRHLARKVTGFNRNLPSKLTVQEGELTPGISVSHGKHPKTGHDGKSMISDHSSVRIFANQEEDFDNLSDNKHLINSSLETPSAVSRQGADFSLFPNRTAQILAMKSPMR